MMLKDPTRRTLRMTFAVAIVMAFAANGFAPLSGAQVSIPASPANVLPSLQQPPALTAPESPADEAAPPWTVSISPPRRIVGDGAQVVTITLTTSNGSGPTPIEILSIDDAGRRVLASLWTPSIEGGRSWQFDASLEPALGLTRIELRRASALGTGGSDPEHVLARTWIERAYEAPLDVTEPFILEEERTGSVLRLPTPIDELGDLSPVPVAWKETRLLVNKAWADSRYGWPAIADASFAVESRGDVAYYSFMGLSAAQVNEKLHTYSISQGQALFGLGSPDSVLLGDRPMRTRILQVPHEEVMAVGPTEATQALVIDFDDGDPTGQLLWFNASWLATMGVPSPQFSYTDGSIIPAQRLGDYWLALPPHFSPIHLTNVGPGAFELVRDGPYASSLSVPGLKGWDLKPDRRDSVDDSLVADFVPHASFTLKATVDVRDQGDGQAAYPLGLGNRSERANPAPDDHDVVRRSVGFYYRSNARHVTYPDIQAYYAGDDGVKQTVWTWSASENPSPSFEFSGLVLQLRLADNQIFFELFDLGGNLDRSLAVSTSLLPMAYLDSIFLASEEGALDTYATPAQLRIKNIDFTPEVGNLVNEDFAAGGALTWQMQADAQLVPNEGSLRLVSALPDQAGLAVASTSVRNARIATEFRYRVGPPVTPEGLSMLFYKNTNYAPASGTAMGFEDATPEIVAGHEGYAIGLATGKHDCRPSPGGEYITLFQDMTCNVLAHTPQGSPQLITQPIPGDGWHTVHTLVNGNRYIVYYDGAPVFKGVQNFDRTYGGLGLSAATTTYGANHDIDYFYASVADFLPITNHVPYVPADPSPTPGTIIPVPPNSVTLSWVSGDIEGNPVTYEVLADTVNPPTTVRCTTSSTSCSLASLEAGKTYYWRVRALDGLSSILGPVWNVVTQFTGAPFTPSAPSPADGAVRKPYTFDLFWVSGAPNGQTVTDKVYFGATNPPTAVQCSMVTTGQCHVSGLATGTVYFWRVESTSLGGTSLGPVWQFTTNIPPNEPSSPSPGSGATGQPMSLSLSWLGGDPDGGLVTYSVAVDTVNPPAAVKCTTTASVCATNLLSYAQQYFWRVTANDGISSVVGPVWSFAVDQNRVPFVPANPWPPTGSSDWTVSGFSLSWTSGDSNGPDPKYTVTFTSTGPPSGLPLVAPKTASGTWCQNVAVPSCTLGILEERTTYTWKVTANDGQLTTEGPTWTLITGVNEPSFLPSRPVPDEGTQGVNTTVRLDWTGGDPDPGSLPSYTVFLDTKNPPGTQRCAAITTASCTVTGLAYNTTYYWRVGPSDGLLRPSGIVWNFTTKQSPVQHPPLSPNAPFPPDSTFLQRGNVSVRWKGGDLDGGQVRYTVWLSNDRFSGPVCVNITTPNCTFRNLTSFHPDDYGYHLWSVEATDGTSTTRGPEWFLVTPPPSMTSYALATTERDCNPSWMPSNPSGGGDFPSRTPHIAISEGEIIDCANPSDNVPCLSSLQDCALDRLRLGQVDYVPADPTPVDRSKEIVPVGLTLAWEAENNGGQRFDVLIGTNSNNMQVACPAVFYDCVVPYDLQWGVEHFWRVVPHGGQGTLGPLWRFTTGKCMDRWCPTPEQQNRFHPLPALPPPPPIPEVPSDGGDDEDDSGLPLLPLPIPPSPLSNPTVKAVEQQAQAGLGFAKTPECAAVSPENRACTVVFMHGIALPDFSVDGISQWLFNRGAWEAPRSSSMNPDAWKVSGFMGEPEQGYSTVVRLGYYGGDCGTTNTATTRGDHEHAWPGGHAKDHKYSNVIGCDGNLLQHTLDTDIRHLAYHVAWYLYEWSDPNRDGNPDDGQYVDVVAHSMGGIVIRTALLKVQEHDKDLPPFLLVEDVVTFGTPHLGTIIGCLAEFRSMFNPAVSHSVRQAQQLCEHDDFIGDLNRAGLPQGLDGTDWSLIGATGHCLADIQCPQKRKNGDFFITRYSATGIPDAPHKYLYHFPAYTHVDYYRHVEPDMDADVEWWGVDPKDGKPHFHAMDQNASRFGHLVYHAIAFKEHTEVPRCDNMFNNCDPQAS